MVYCSWDMAQDRCNCYFSFWTVFCPFNPITAQKIKILKNEKKTKPENIIILHMCTKNYDQMMYGSWDMVCDRWMDGQTDGWKRWHIEAGAHPKNKQKNKPIKIKILTKQTSRDLRNCQISYWLTGN